jgi:hypothetical protein
MRTFARQISMIALLTVLMAPGLLQARTAPVRHRAQASASATAGSLGSFLSVWNLLTSYLKNGGQMDPNGSPLPPPSGTNSTTMGDNGGQMDPNGVPKP